MVYFIQRRQFLCACLHTLSLNSWGGEKMPPPFGPAVHGTRPNDLLQFDYIDLGDSKNGDKYVQLLRDDRSDCKRFYCLPDTGAENAATAVIEWCSIFGVPKMLMSDGPTHFKNETLQLVWKGLKVPHHCTLAYCPWSDGAVERLGRELICVLRETLSELRMDNKEWTDLIPIVQLVLKNSPSPRRGNICPATSFMRRDPTRLSKLSSALKLRSPSRFPTCRTRTLSPSKSFSSCVTNCVHARKLVFKRTTSKRAMLCVVVSFPTSEGRLRPGCPFGLPCR